MNFKAKVSILLLILLLPFAVSNFTLAGGYGQVSVKRWADNRNSAFSFTFDDGTMCHYTYVKPVLDSFGFKGTFFIICDSITNDLPGIGSYGTWNQFKEMAIEGHEIGSHSVAHPDFLYLTDGDISTPGTLLYELFQSKNTIEQKIVNQKCITIAYPYFDYNTNVINMTTQFYESARTSDSSPIDSSLIGSGFYTIGGHEEHFNTPRNSTQDDLDELVDYQYYIENSISVGRWGMLVAHEVVPFSQIADLLQQDSWYPMSTEWLTSLCQWIKQKSDNNEVWVESMGNITRYMKEREEFQYNIVAQTSTQIQINATDNLNNDIFNYPLTVDFSVPPDWEAAIVTQGSRTDTIITVTAGTNVYVRAKIIPDGGIINLNKEAKPLPVELSSFTATIINNGVRLNWKTSIEINSNRFDIERRTKGKSWEQIGSYPGAGNSNSPKAYSFVDNFLLSNEKYFYKLKITDNDGHYKYSGTVEADVNSVPRIYSLEQNYPNPFNPETTIRYQILNPGVVTLKVYDVLGREVAILVDENKMEGFYEVSFDASKLVSGIYMYTLRAGNFSLSKKMLLMK
jgi:peptidoglycan/xylan/chitin deacetylase (PgdA/CDA1 family)